MKINKKILLFSEIDGKYRSSQRVDRSQFYKQEELKVWDQFWKLTLDLNPGYLADTSNLKRHLAKRHINVSESGRYPVVNNELFRELIAKAIARHHLPFAFVE